MRHDRIFFLIAMVAAAACGDSASDTKGESSGAQSGAGGGSSGATTAAGGSGSSVSTGSGGGGEGGSLLTGPGVTGFVHDEDGVPIAKTAVLACTSVTCYFGTSNSAGRFAFELTPPVDVAVKTEEDLSFTPRRGAALVPVSVTETEPLDIGGVFVPNLPTGAMVGPTSADPQTLDVGDGLTLTVSREDLSPPLGHDLTDIAARAIPSEHLHPIAGLGSEEIVAVYALHPFSSTSDTAVAVRAPTSLPAGTKVKFRTISWINGNLSDPATGTSDGAFVETDAAEGIYDLTWLVISK